MEKVLAKKTAKSTFHVQIDFSNMIIGKGKILCFENNQEAEFEGALQLIRLLDGMLNTEA